MWRWLLLPFFILQAAWEFFTTPVKEDDMILFELSPRNREIWKTLTPEQREKFRRTLKQMDIYDEAIARSPDSVGGKFAAALKRAELRKLGK